MENALPRFSQVVSLTPSKYNSTKDIRDLIKKSLGDDDFFDSITPHLIPEGTAGNRQMDQALVAEKFFNHQPMLRTYSNLNHKLLWGHVSHVLNSYGYVFTGGRITGCLLENKQIETVNAVYDKQDTAA